MAAGAPTTREDIPALQTRLNALLTLPQDPSSENSSINPQGFSVFDEAQLNGSLNISGEFMTIANNNPDHPFGAVLDSVDARLHDDINDNEAVRHALMVFLTHYPPAQQSGLKITSLSTRAPSLAVPVSTGAPAPDGQDTEVALNYWREDVNLNEHHEHWHIVYPGGGVPNPRNPSQRQPRDRQGELFYWMHQQMIARYNAERLSNGFGKVLAIKDFGDVLESDVPDANLRYNGKSFTPRPAGLKMGDLGHKGQKDYYPLSQLVTWRERLIEACKSGKWNDGTPVTASSLGGTLEANIESKDNKYYGNLHNMGHVIIAYLANAADWQNQSSTPGLMYQTRTAVRDPVFWRWHSMVDDLFYLWQENQPPLKFDDVPQISFRKTGAPAGSPDIITVFNDVIAGSGVDVNNDAAVEAWGEQTFGGSAWDSAPNPQFSTDVFETEFRKRRFTNIGDDGNTEEISYIFPREFGYFFRISNTTSKELKVTLRINLVPAQDADNRRSYFEMDKFQITIPANSKKVFYRRSDQSSVIRKPAQKTVEQMDDRRDEDDGLNRSGSDGQYCDCGWPFNMLIPKGSSEGIPFKLSVLATDWNKDNVPTNTGCGSMSFCGAKDKYPDSREMGYPFIRKFEKSVTETIASVPSWAVKDVVIRNVTAFTTGTPTKPVTAAAVPTPGPTPVNVTPAPTNPSQEGLKIPKQPGLQKQTSREVLSNGDILHTVVEFLEGGLKKITKTTSSQVPHGQPGPWDKSKPGTSVRTEVDGKGNTVEVTETIDEHGVKRVSKKIVKPAPVA
ncbi:Polyphenol oxidase 1 [Nowakowskiella sp. JEL0078]|nr:Polyphenol oxidase 1 [Nowakowskiella sp. JEL0078]